MRVLVVDMGSRVNVIGGQAKLASILFTDLKKDFDTYYLGYETEYLKGGLNAIILKRSKRLGVSLRQSKLSENGILRLGYNIIIVRGMRNLGINKNELAELIRKISPDVVIANSMQDIVVLRYLKKRGIKFRSIYIDHGNLSTNTTSGYFSKEGIPLTIGSGLIASSVGEAKKKFLDFFDIDVAINLEQKRRIEQIGAKAVYIPNGLKPSSKQDPKTKALLMRNFGISKENFVVLYVGRMFERQKNVSVLIKAFMGINDPKMRLLLVGEGPSLADYADLAKNDKRVILAGRLDERVMPSIYEISDVFVLPSNWEGFSITMLEAATHLVPLILSEKVYINDIKGKDIGDVLSFKPDDAQALANLIIKISKDKKIMNRAKKTSANITRKFSEEKMIKQYKDLILNLSDKRILK